MHKHCFIKFALYFVLENCVFYVTMKKETIRKSNTDIAIFEIILQFEHSFASLWHIVLFV